MDVPKFGRSAHEVIQAGMQKLRAGCLDAVPARQSYGR
jgi:hypothetical protein